MAFSKEYMAKLGEKTRFIRGEQQAKIASMGGIASAKAKKAQKTMQEKVLNALAIEITDDDGEIITTEDTIIATALLQAMEGDDKARTFLRDTSGQKPADKNETTIKMPEVALIKFV